MNTDTTGGPPVIIIIKIKKIIVRMEEGRSASNILTGKPTGKRPSGSPRRRWEDLEEIGINAGN